ncbi:MAG: 16S rRNA (adenine(1518)-N(6)/adenine(1519)-N(6))-dimethyltransferase RsmA [Candidatus Liptonbacteria bacterium]
MTKLGQHFLIHKGAIRKIIRALDLGEGEMVIEIGPGHGELSLPLAGEIKKLGGKLILIEKDVKLAKELKVSAPKDTVEIIWGDALRVLPGITEGPGGYKLAGNLPYYISGYFFRTISELRNKPAKTVVMIQREVGERLCAAPPKMNRLAAAVQFWGKPKIIMTLKSQDFRPAPKVDSAIVEISARTEGRSASPEKYYPALRALFRQPRKNILNNLAAGETVTKKYLAEKLSGIGISPDLRSQDLSVEQICEIAKLVIRT